MTRRHLIKAVIASTVTIATGLDSMEALAGGLKVMESASNPQKISTEAKNKPANDSFSDDYFHKMEKFYRPHADDIFLVGKNLSLMQSCWLKLRKTSKIIGYGNFNILGFDDFLRVCCSYRRIGKVSADELAFLEKIFYTDAKSYGFYGERVFHKITTKIPRKEVAKLHDSGQYLFRDGAVELYKKLKGQVGGGLVMTSGIRGIPKQMFLFLNKAVSTHGNLSLASRAIAPPGYSFHGCGDFDIGRHGWGHRNFTKEFENTSEFKELYRLGYVKLRYPHGNLLGVRYEPWHVRNTRTL